MKKKIFVLGFTVEGFEQVGAFDPFDDDNDGDSFDDDTDKLPNDNMDDIQDENLQNGDNAIDELDKAYLIVQGGGSAKKVQAESDFHISALESVFSTPQLGAPSQENKCYGHLQSLVVKKHWRSTVQKRQNH